MNSRVKCSYCGCKNNKNSHPSKVFFKIPNDRARCTLWLNLMGRNDLLHLSESVLHNNIRVCADHFSEANFTSSMRSKLLTFAAPVDSRNMQNDEDSSREATQEIVLSHLTKSCGRVRQRSGEADPISKDHNDNQDEPNVTLLEDVQHNSITFKMLKRDIRSVRLPSKLWVIQKDPQDRFVAFSRIPLQFEENQLTADKVVVFTETMVPAVFFKEIKLDLPSVVSPLWSIEQVSSFLEKIQRLAFCIAETQDSKCCIYLDIPSPVGYCSKCTANHADIVNM